MTKKKTNINIPVLFGSFLMKNEGGKFFFKCMEYQFCCMNRLCSGSYLTYSTYKFI